VKQRKRLYRVKCPFLRKIKILRYKDIKGFIKKTKIRTASTQMTTRVLDGYFRLVLRITGRGVENPMNLKLFGNSQITKAIIKTTTAVQTLKEYIFLRHAKSREEGLAIAENKSVVCMCVGDGITPRCGYLLAGSTSWNVTSVDPEMGKEWVADSRIKNLRCIRACMEDVDIPIENKASLCLIVSVHGHANMDVLWKRMTTRYKRVVALSIPCWCKKFVHRIDGIKPILNFAEKEIFPKSKRTVFVWDSG